MIIGLGMTNPSRFLQSQDYSDILTKIFNKTVQEGERKDYDQSFGFTVRFEKDGVLYKAEVVDVNKDEKYEPYDDFGYLKSVSHSPQNGKTKVDYARISYSFSRLTTREISATTDSDRFEKLDKKRIFEILHPVDAYYRSDIEGFEIPENGIKRGESIPSDPNSNVLRLYKTFAEHFNVNRNLENDQV